MSNRTRHNVTNRHNKFMYLAVRRSDLRQYGKNDLRNFSVLINELISVVLTMYVQ